MSGKIYTNVQAHQPGNTSPVNVVCPACRQRGTFAPTPNVQDSQVHILNINRQQETFCAGTRICPNLQCKAFIFVFYQAGASSALASFPVARIDFDTADVPEPVVKAFDEALACHANECWMAAAMLIRKSIEELCEDRGATGNVLIERIKSLRGKVTLPDELFEAAEHLRLLGNDAAHIEAKAYTQVGKDEVEAGIDLAKELIKSVYQYKGLLGKLLGKL